MKGKLVKISRYGESFWIRDVREIEPGMFVGAVDNDLGPNNPFRAGDPIPFALCEIGEVMDYPKPRLSVVT